MADIIFQDRHGAGLELAVALDRFRASRPLILALPRGGVPVAFEIACALETELDLVFVRKLGAPGHAELGIGAVVDGADPQMLLNDDLVRQIRPDPDYIEAEFRRQLVEIERRRRTYAGGRPPIPTTGRIVIVVDDGIATGATARTALAALRRTAPAELVLAVPIAPEEIIPVLQAACDELVCLATPKPFHAVGAHYVDFTQTSDDEVVSLLDRAAAFARPVRTGTRL
jgi:putative phosphoribosyl transferase